MVYLPNEEWTIEYEKINGERSTRNITVKEVLESDKGKTYIVGFDHEANGYRRFLEDRIRKSDLLK